MTALLVKPPHYFYKSQASIEPSVFLAGSIEMGEAEDWQTIVFNALKDSCSIIYNPRRDDWDNSWKQSIDDLQFSAQVNWELDMIEYADLILFYFDPETKSPISLLELGKCAALKPSQTLVACPKGFWRKGNIDIVCNRADIPVLSSLDELIRSANDFITAS